MSKQKTGTKSKCHVKKGDRVKVIAGNDKGKIDTIIGVDTQKNRVTVKNVNLYTKITQQQKGRKIRERKEASIHISNVMLIEPNTQQPTRTGRRPNEQNKLQRFAKKTNQFI